MGKLEVTCPCGCNHTFVADILDSDYYENLVAQWTGGKLANAGNAGYDVSIRAEGEIITIQVKYSSIHTRKSKPKGGWKFQQNITKITPDIFVLFGLTNYGYEVFSMRYDSFISRIRIETKTNQRQCAEVFETSCGNDSFIWNYHVDNPEKNLLPRIKAMIADRQLGLW